MNEMSGAEAFVRMLQLFGVKHIFGLCGNTSLPLYDALYRLDHGITAFAARARLDKRLIKSEWVARRTELIGAEM